MSEKRALIIIFLSGLFLSCLLGVVHTEEQYRISETQLQSIESLAEKLEAERQTWQSQANVLKQEAQTLNAQLRTERELYNKLQTSFDEYEIKNLTLLTERETAISELKDENAKEKIKTTNTEKQRNTAIFIAILGVFLAGLFIFLWIRK
ncbi:hypothetical protein K7I13_12210 [Brucepastera parasyntrophica]|uniref:hypothetical protein n=1 Tax=Brucepastera parasyntrophica TaxID=2880008 RepID=UPI00210DFA9E|nr:hypothetical protein [Brucepastera parasyntrophica]ULQ59249.1 hypothetical protein K7I13_12210 [Brucepastera parasyntrophica]